MQKLVIQNVQAGRDLNIFVDGRASGGVSAKFQLPPAPELFGRQDLIADLITRMRLQAYRKGLLVYGMPGVGKTSLLINLGHKLRETHSDAQIFVSFAGTEKGRRKALTAADAMRKVIRSFHPTVEIPEDEDQLNAAYRSVLTEAGNVLLVFDDVVGPEQISGLVPPSNCAWILSSRSRITLLELESQELGCLDWNASVEMLQSLAPPIGELASTVANYCAGLPLALQFFSAQLRKQPLIPAGDLAREFQAAVATVGPVAASIRLSYDRLSVRLQLRLSLLAVFARDFQLSAAQVVWELDEATTRDELQSLLDSNLVQFDRELERFALHEFVRAFLNSEHPNWVLHRARIFHAHYFARVCDLIGAFVIRDGSEKLTGLRLFDQERSEIEAAFNFIREEKAKHYAKTMADLGRIAGLVGHLRFSSDEQIEWLMAARSAAKRARSDDRYIDATGNLANAFIRRNEYEKARPYAMELLQFGRRHRDRTREGNALTCLALIEKHSGHPQRAIELLRDRMAIARETGDRGAIVRALNNLANAYDDLNELDEQMRCLREALALAESQGEIIDRASTMNNLGMALLKQGLAGRFRFTS